ncbi:signal transduction histidine kinase [Filimonas zeae]|uniref:histidine kinase n=1 Tax=Filimonas zeae TaxID=1737353 RepID=A0A917MT98_9BACT|nr:HAMP domain-containing sensor histidine kinase [Filimonas zeae]MDR6338225.1 signal transduction histidine kinase [Filimonas zeae]GGH62341.1 two-component sensor histidine kinase [Filimonas zeae]
MIQAWLNWRNGLVIMATAIVIAVIFYSQYLSHKLEADERKKVDAWVEAQKAILTSNDGTTLALAAKISLENTDIPIIETNERDSITGNYLNLDSTRAAQSANYLPNMVARFRKLHPPIVVVLKEQPLQANKYYYGRSFLQQQLRYYPIVFLLIIALFTTLAFLFMKTSYQSTQNQLWAGMAKETAHQLGTPVSSLQGWVAVLKEDENSLPFALEIEKDVNRLQLVTDRFGKIGSTPQLEQKDITEQIGNMLDYMKKRAGNHVVFSYSHPSHPVFATVSAPLFDWVIENLLKNALDAMEGKGFIELKLQEQGQKIWIDVTDTGKGIPQQNLNKIFQPGFTTRKRGWGLGLTLTRRIIEQYHKGLVFVKWSEPGKGTTFRIILDNPAIAETKKPT